MYQHFDFGFLTPFVENPKVKGFITHLVDKLSNLSITYKYSFFCVLGKLFPFWILLALNTENLIFSIAMESRNTLVFNDSVSICCTWGWGGSKSAQSIKYFASFTIGFITFSLLCCMLFNSCKGSPLIGLVFSAKIMKKNKQYLKTSIV